MTRALALLSCAICLLLSHTASAKPKVALTQIEGDATGDVRDAVAEAIEGKELSLIGSREVNRAVDKLGDLADLTEKDFKKLATELEADAIVTGKLDKIGGSKTLRFRLFVHKKMAKGFTVSFKDPKSEKFRALLHDKMIDKIGGAGGEDEDARPAKKKKAAEDEEDPLATKSGKKAKKSKASEDEEEVRPAKKGKLAKAEDEDARPSKKAKAEAKAEEEDAKPAKKAKAVAEDEDARPARKAKAVAEDEDAKPARKKADDEARPDEAAGKADEDDAPRRAKKKVADAEEGDELEVTATAGRPAGARPANRAAIRLDLGGSVQRRSFKFNSNAPVPKNVAMSPVLGARLDGEVYPLAMSNGDSPLAGIGLGFEYDRTLSLTLTTTNNTMSYSVPVKQSHYSLGLRYRLAFGKSETAPTLTVGAGYGKRLFSTDRSKITDPVALANVRRDTPESEYTVIDPGLMFRLPVTRMVAFSVGGTGLIVTNAGPIAQKENYGRAKVYGAEAIAAVDVIIGSHYALRFSGEYVQVGFAFQGGGQLSNGLDAQMNLGTQEVGGLADRSIGGSATFALLY
jgi:hypothetical protein